jgi:diketogulonate reductase-like aldo/keto reductase
MTDMPTILYGTAWKKERTATLVATALQQGFRGVDTAGQPKHYDEAGVGAGIAAFLRSGLPRGELYIQTKFTPADGHDPLRMPYDARAPLPEQVAQSFASSLRNLGTGYVDALVLHSPLRSPRDLLSVWHAMEALVDAGTARRLGISNCYDLDVLEALHAAARVKPTIVQNRFYAQTRYDHEIRAFCSMRGIVYQSFWTLTANPALLEHPVVEAIALRLARTPEQILFRYLSESGVVPLTGTTSVEHMRSDLAISEFELGAEGHDEIAALIE